MLQLARNDRGLDGQRDASITRMVRHLYVQALLRDPILAEMIKVVLDDGQIDEVAAILAWRMMFHSGHSSGYCMALEDQLESE